MTETTHYGKIWHPEKKGNVQMQISAQCHPQLAGQQGTWPVRGHITLYDNNIFNSSDWDATINSH